MRTLSHNIPLTSKFQPREISALERNTYPANPKHGITFPRGSTSHISDPDPIHSCNLQDDTGNPIEPPAFRGYFAEEGRSSPSISSSDDGLEEFMKLPDAHGSIPIDPVDLVILATHGSWEDTDLQLSISQADSLTDSRTICPYPDPPPVLHCPPDHYCEPCEKAGDQNDKTQISDHPRIHDGQQQHLSQHNTDPDASHPNGSCGNHHISGQSKSMSGRCNNQAGELANGFGLPLCYRPGEVPL